MLTQETRVKNVLTDETISTQETSRVQNVLTDVLSYILRQALRGDVINSRRGRLLRFTIMHFSPI